MLARMLLVALSLQCILGACGSDEEGPGHDATVDGPTSDAGVLDSAIDSLSPSDGGAPDLVIGDAGLIVFAAVPSAAGLTWVGDDGASVPVIGIFVDRSGAPQRSASVDYQISGAASVDGQGTVTGSALSGLTGTATLTGTAGDASATREITVAKKAKETITLSGTFRFIPFPPLANAAWPIVVEHLQGDATANVSQDGAFSIALPAGSFYTLRLSMADYASTNLSGIAPVDDTDAGDVITPFIALAFLDLTKPTCVTFDDTKGIVGAEMAMVGAENEGWELFISDGDARQVYTGADGQSLDCALTKTTLSGRSTFYNVAPGLHWVVAHKGSRFLSALVDVSAGSVAMITPWQ